MILRQRRFSIDADSEARAGFEGDQQGSDLSPRGDVRIVEIANPGPIQGGPPVLEAWMDRSNPSPAGSGDSPGLSLGRMGRPIAVSRATVGDFPAGTAHPLAAVTMGAPALKQVLCEGAYSFFAVISSRPARLASLRN